MAQNGMLSPQEIDALVAAKAQSPEMEKVMKAVLQRESNYGQNPAAYVANKAGGVIGIGQIQSKQVGGKYNNFENYADAGQTDIRNPIHTANAALNMIADKWNKSKGNTQQFVNEYFGRAAKDKLGGTNIGYVQAINKAIANGVSTPTGNSAFQGVVGIPRSALSDVKSYNSQIVQAAQKIADNNLAAVNNFNWNPNTTDSSAQRFGKTVSNNTDALSQLYDTNMREMQAFTNPTADTYLGRVGDKLGAMWNVSGNTLTEKYLKRAEASQSSTGKAMAEQVANMKSVLDGTVINPALLDKAAGNLTQQQQVDNQTYNAVTGNANTQQQLKQQLDIATMQNETEKDKVAAAVAKQKANGVTGNPDDSSLVKAARSLGIELPEGMKTSDIKATLGDKLQTVQAVAANNGTLGSDPYTAVKVAQMPGVSPEVLMAAQPHIAFQKQVLDNAKLPPPGMMVDKDGKFVANPVATKESIAAEQASYDAKARAIVIKAYEDAANGAKNPYLKNVTANPYSAMRRGEEIKTLANGLPLPKGIEPSEVGTLGAERFIRKASESGATSLEIANFYKGLSTNVSKGIKFDIFAAPKATGSFKVKLKGIDNSIDLATPAGVEQFKAIVAAGNVQRADNKSFWGALGDALVATASDRPRKPTGAIIYE